VNVWFDIDNAPQTRYLVPLARALERRHHHVVLTARDHGETLELLTDDGVEFSVIGSGFGRGVPRKLLGVAQRGRELARFLDGLPTRIDILVTGSRAATLVARRRRIVSFVIIDYEHVDLLMYRLTAANVFYPDVIDPRSFESRGISPERLLPFHGLKEDLSFADVDLAAVQPFELNDCDRATPRVLFRPPAEESHYYRSESRQLALALLRYLAANDVQVVLSPRHKSQVEYLSDVGDWRQPPIVLDHPAPFVGLLKAVDAVVSAGGTMLREAAYLGVPAYSIFRSRIGAVDRYLESIGRLTLITTPADFSRLALERRGEIEPLRVDSQIPDELAQEIESRLGSPNVDGLGRAAVDGSAR
jgi:hypothetical protein